MLHGGSADLCDIIITVTLGCSLRERGDVEDFVKVGNTRFGGALHAFAFLHSCEK